MSAKGMFASPFVAVTLLLGTSYDATGRINVNTRYQTIEGFGAAGTWYEGWQDGLTADYISIQNKPDYDASRDSCRFEPSEATSYTGYSLASEPMIATLTFRTLT
jgi:O-glycosyl hydrolase